MIVKNSPGRLSARWKVFQNTINGTRIKMAGIVLWLFVLLLMACQDKSTAQNELSNQDNITSQSKTDSLLKKPKVDIKVNRHFDDKGNMIGFDSTYSTYYSSVEGDTTRMDSVRRF